MTVNLVQWRAVIGIFNCRSSVMPSYECNLNKNLASLFEVLLFCWHCFESAFTFLLTLVYIFIFLYIHPDNIKRGGVCIYYKESLPIRVISTPYFKEALLLEMSYNNKKVMVSVIYRCPSQTNDEFDTFLSNLRLLLNDIIYRKPSLSVVAGDFNSRCSSRWSNDINTTKGLKLFSSTSSNGFSQLIHEPTHIQANSLSCIDLVFTDQPNLWVNSGVHASLHPNCHHQIVHSSFNLNIYYPPPYQRLIWDYKKADVNITRKALDSVNWERLFDSKNINEQVIECFPKLCT